jgi:hypothetical protein
LAMTAGELIEVTTGSTSMGGSTSPSKQDQEASV